MAHRTDLKYIYIIPTAKKSSILKDKCLLTWGTLYSSVQSLWSIWISSTCLPGILEKQTLFMFLREMNSVRGLCKKKYSLGTKKPRAFLELQGQRAKIIDPLNMWNEWLAIASSSALEVLDFSLESDLMSHPIKGPQMWSAFTSPPGTRHSCCSANNINSKSQVPFSALSLAWQSLNSSFLDGPSVVTEVGLHVLSTSGRG